MRPGGMEKQMRRVAYLSVLLPLLAISLWAQEENQEPVVTNPIAKQLDYERVLVTYDVKDVDGNLMTVIVKVSDDRGKTFSFTVPREQLSGDVGEGASRRHQYSSLLHPSHRWTKTRKIPRDENAHILGTVQTEKVKE